MSRTKKILIYAAAAICIAAVATALVAYQWLTPDDGESVSETPVTSEFLSAMRAAGYPITINRAVSARSYGGWHGDGQEVTAYRYPPHESGALIAALQQMQPEVSWSEKRSRYVADYSPWTLLPQELQPESSSSVLLVGRSPDGMRLREFIVDRARGTLYITSHRF